MVLVLNRQRNLVFDPIDGQGNLLENGGRRGALDEEETGKGTIFVGTRFDRAHVDRLQASPKAKGGSSRTGIAACTRSGSMDSLKQSNESLQSELPGTGLCMHCNKAWSATEDVGSDCLKLEGASESWRCFGLAVK